MQRRDNPYTPGAGRKPPNLAGRDADLEDFGALLAALERGGTDRSLVYYGLRGVGKTVLLMELDLIAAPFGENAATYFPVVGDLWFTWLMVGLGGERLAKIGQTPFLALAALAARRETFTSPS